MGGGGFFPVRTGFLEALFKLFVIFVGVGGCFSWNEQVFGYNCITSCSLLISEFILVKECVCTVFHTEFGYTLATKLVMCRISLLLEKRS